jgi:hypothetical protein
MNETDIDSKNKNTKRGAQVSRRAFLRGSGCAVGAAGVMTVTLAQIPNAAASTAPDRHQAGYRETEHVRRVYELARF